jgi:hypothetical protein
VATTRAYGSLELWSQYNERHVCYFLLRCAPRLQFQGEISYYTSCKNDDNSQRFNSEVTSPRNEVLTLNFVFFWCTFYSALKMLMHGELASQQAVCRCLLTVRHPSPHTGSIFVKNNQSAHSSHDFLHAVLRSIVMAPDYLINIYKAANITRAVSSILFFRSPWFKHSQRN